jgi:2-dehydropantoate 2-reductase
MGDRMKICIFGAGAIGGYLAAQLATVESVELSVVARGAHLEAIRRDGLRLESPSGARTVRVRATDQAAELGPQDVVFIALKSHQVTPALEQLVALLGPDTAVVPPTTGIPYWYFHGVDGPNRGRRLEALDPGGLQWSAVSPERVLGCVYFCAAEVLSPGVVFHGGAKVRFPLGEPDGSDSARVRRLAAVMEAAGIEAPVVPDIRGWIWSKLISSLCWNPVAVLTTATLADLNASPAIVSLVRRMMAEADALAAKAGVANMPVSIGHRMAGARAIGAHKMSMLQDLERGRPLEIDALTDSITTMKALLGVETPVIDDIYALLDLRARKRAV